MKKKKFTESQIVKILKEHESGRDVQSLSREYGFNKSTLYIWKKKYGGLETSELKRLKELEEENRRLKQMYADLSLDHKILKEVIEKKL